MTRVIMIRNGTKDPSFRDEMMRASRQNKGSSSCLEIGDGRNPYLDSHLARIDRRKADPVDDSLRIGHQKRYLAVRTALQLDITADAGHFFPDFRDDDEVRIRIRISFISVWTLKNVETTLGHDWCQESR